MTMPKFKYGDTAAISGAAIENGSFLVDTSARRMYVDLGGSRLALGGGTGGAEFPTVESKAAIESIWDNDPSVRGTLQVYFGLSSNVSDSSDVQLGHFYLVWYLPEVFSFTPGSTSHPENPPSALPPGYWEVENWTYLELPSSFGNAAGRYFMDSETGLWTKRQRDRVIGDSGTNPWAFNGWYSGPDADVWTAYQTDTDCISDGTYVEIEGYNYQMDSSGNNLTEENRTAALQRIVSNYGVTEQIIVYHLYNRSAHLSAGGRSGTSSSESSTISIKYFFGSVNAPCLCVTDSALSATSTNPVQNSVVQAALTALESRVAALEAGGSSSSSSSSSSSAPTTGQLTVNGVGFPSGAQWTVDGGTTWYNIGDTATLSPGNYTLVYKEVSGYLTPSSQSATVSAGSTTTITANSYTQYGTLLVNYTGTAPSGAQWTHDGGTTWTNFGSSVSVAPGSYTITYKAVSGYTSPTSASATVTSGNTTTIAAGTYTASVSTFGLIVRYRNAQTVPSGAAWSYDGSTWNSFPGSVNLAPGSYTLTFKAVSGYVTPSAISFTAAANDSIVYDDIYYATESTGYPNAFVVTGADTSPSTSTAAIAAVNGTYVKQATTTTYGGSTYPVYYNGYYYLWKSKNDGGIALNTSMDSDEGGMPSMYNVYHIGEVALTASAMSTNWYENGYTTSNYITLTFATSSATTPEYGTLVSDPVDTTKPFLTVANSSTTTYNGNYYLYQGTASATGTAGSIWKHETASYFISYYSSPSSGSGWYLYDTLAKAQAPTNNYGYYTAQVGTGTSNATSDFNGGRTFDGYTVTYDANSGSSGGTPYVEVVNNSDSTYAGNYYLYSGSADDYGARFKHATQEYYLGRTGQSGSWMIRNNAGSDGNLAIRLSDVDPDPAPTCFYIGYEYEGYYVTYHAS